MFLKNIFTNCQICCHRLFKDDYAFPSHDYDFFGLTSYSKSFEIFNSIGSIPKRDEELSQNLFTPHFHKLILQHCIMSSYHAIRTELEGQKEITSYGIENKDSMGRTNAEKSSKARSMEKKVTSHLNAIPFVEDLICLNSQYHSQFSYIWKVICNINADWFKGIYNPDKKITSVSILYLIQHIC